jgi:hypothetical protein
MSCICIAGSNQFVLDLVAKVLKASGMNLLVGEELQAESKTYLSDVALTSVGAARLSITPQRLSQVIQVAKSTHLAGWADTSNLNSLPEWLRIEPGLYFVLVTSKLTDVIAQALDDYDNVFDCAEVVASWQQNQQKLLHFFYRHRERCVLVESQDCLENTQDFVGECKLSLSVQLQVPTEQLSVWPKFENSVSLHFAKRLLESFPEALSLENELATCIRKFAKAQAIRSDIEQQSAELLLLSDYRAQRQLSQESLRLWVEENTKLLCKIERIQTENQRLFNQSQKSEQQFGILSEEAEVDRKTIAKLEAELERARTQMTEVRAENNELSKNNEHLFFDLREVQHRSELSFERNTDLELQITTLASEVNKCQTLADLRQIDLEHALQKNVQLQQRKGDVEAENDVLLTQFQESLIDLESYILKNRTLQSQIAAEQEVTKGLETRIREVTVEYETLDQAHVLWRSERETLIDQIELKQNALTVQSEECERAYSEFQLQLSALQEKESEAEGKIEILSEQLEQVRTDLGTIVVENQVLQDSLTSEKERVGTLDARLLEVEREYDSISTAHILWLEERENLLALNAAMQSELSALKQAHESLLLELSEEQILAEQQFSQNEHAVAKLKSLELEKNAVEARLVQALQKHPTPVECERIEILQPPAGDQLKMQWQAVGLETGIYHQPSLLFSTIIEDSALGLIFSRQQAANNGLIRWPEILSTSNELVLSPVGSATTGPIRAETWLSLATTDLDTVIALSFALEKELKNDGIVIQLGQDISSRLLAGLDAFKYLSSETQSTFRYDRVRLKRATVNDDYEHLWLEFDNVSFNSVRSAQFECRIACSELISKRFGSFPKLEFPSVDSSQTLSSWYAESHDDFGDKLELRFAPPELFDIEVWGKLSHDDQGFIFGLLDRLPTILRELDLDSVGLHRPWPQWNSVVEHMSKCLVPAMTSLLLKDTQPAEPPALADHSHAASFATKPDLSKLGEQSATATSAALTSKTLAKRPTSSAFLSFLQES